MVVSGSLQEIRSRIKSKGLMIVRLAEHNEDQSLKLFNILNNSTQISGLQKISDIEIRASFLGDAKEAAWLLAQLVKQNILIAEFNVKQDNVEDIFFKIGAHEVS